VRRRSFKNDDLIASDLVYNHVRGEPSRVEFKPEYYFSEQQRDEILLIRVHDGKETAEPDCRFILFSNKLAEGAPPRESIEVRTLVFFPPDSLSYRWPPLRLGAAAYRGSTLIERFAYD
jgi:hypothetical protein